MLRRAIVIAVLLRFAICCTEARDKGFKCDGSPSVMRFYHDAKSGRCQPFFFLGCGGNGNNFADRETCESNCLSPTKSSPKVAQAGNDTIITSCSLKTSAVLREPAAACSTTADCAAGHACTNGSCCPTKAHICSLTPSNGNEAAEFEFKHRPKHAWIGSLNNCIRQVNLFIELFSYFGVNGNANNFPSYKECVAFCGGQ